MIVLKCSGRHFKCLITMMILIKGSVCYTEEAGSHMCTLHEHLILFTFLNHGATLVSSHSHVRVFSLKLAYVPDDYNTKMSANYAEFNMR